MDGTLNISLIRGPAVGLAELECVLRLRGVGAS